MKKLITVACFCLFGAATLLQTGCETESVSNNDLTITPSSIGLRNGDTAVFTASGGFDYSWSLQNPSWGTLSALTGPTTTYTDRYVPGSNGNASAVQVLTVTSSIQGANSSGTGGSSSSNDTTTATNADVIGTATAQIEHMPTSSATGTNVTQITISSSTSAPLTIGSTASLTASGGNGSYSWSLDPSSVVLSESNVGTLAPNGTGNYRATFTDECTPASTNGFTATIYVTDTASAQGTISLILAP